MGLPLLAIMKMHLLSKKDTKGKKIFDIVSWILVLLLFGTALTLLIARKANGSLAIFGHRYDVVVSESMSYKYDIEKDKEHYEFLEGHDDQIQKMDVVRSKTVDATTELNVYDIILFKDDRVANKTNMHRIVDKQIKSKDVIYLKNVEIDKEYIKFTENGSLATEGMPFNEAVITFYSTKSTYSDNYYFGNAGTFVDNYTVNTIEVDDGYYHIVTVDRTSTAPTKFTVIINHEKSGYENESIVNLKFNSKNGDVNINGTDFEMIDGVYTSINNLAFEYQTRGDAASDNDPGWKTIDEIYSKVDKIIPKGGYFTSFITSLPGIIMFIGLGILIVGVDVGLEYIDKKEKEKSKLNLYYSSKSSSLMMTTYLKDNVEEVINGECIGKDRYEENIYKFVVDKEKVKQIKFTDEDKSSDIIDISEVKSGTGFYMNEEGLKTYVQEESKGDKNAKS